MYKPDIKASRANESEDVSKLDKVKIFHKSLLLSDESKADKVKFVNYKPKLSKCIIKAINKLGFEYMTDIQSAVLPKALKGCDIIATAKTGSGKTLAYLIPIIEFVRRLVLDHNKGTLALVIVPTRELAMQIYDLLHDMIKAQGLIRCGLVIGGESKSEQEYVLSDGAHIIIATPGRLLDHMKSRNFNYKNIKYLVIDEADKMFQHSFDHSLQEVIQHLPKNRQTMLFSATQSEKIKTLVKIALNDTVEFVSLHDRFSVEGLDQGYVFCKSEDRLWWLFGFLKKVRDRKVIVFFSSCKSVEFHYEFFHTYCDASVLCIHGNMSQSERSTSIRNFYTAKKGRLFCTDVVARGIDIPRIDWICQFDPPADVNEYVHRVGRTARGEGATGNAILLLRPEEKFFLKYLNEADLFPKHYKSWDTYVKSQLMLENLVIRYSDFKELATEAFEAYVRSFCVKKLKDVFDITTLNLDNVARSFGLKERPSIDTVTGFKKKFRKRKVSTELSSTNTTKRKTLQNNTTLVA